MPTISFKLPDAQAAALLDKAEQWGSNSEHRAAKHIVQSYLNDSARTSIRQDIADLRREVIRLREDLATAVAALLVKAGKINDVQEAKQWVARNLPLS